MRHGRTAWNLSGRFQGGNDVPLDAVGRSQAEATADALSVAPVDVIVSSDLSRALETARAIASRHGIEVVPDPGLREFSFGAWEGLTWDEIVARHPEEAGRSLTSVREYAPTGGERFPEVRARVAGVLARHRHAGKRVVFVTHAGALHALLDILAGDREDVRRVRLTPGSITRFAMDGERPRLTALDDVRHHAV